MTHIAIPTRDGTRLAAALFRPVVHDPVPVVVEYTPYRKDDLRAATRDFGHFYLAERGVASVQLDVRGTGGSEGVVSDEYQYPQEQQDGYDAVEWLAHQPWCNGKAGMWGTSYAGFTALQVAQLQPPSLGAIAPIYATDDRYTDDMHFRGGALNGWNVIGPYALGMVTRNALPPYPGHAQEDWRALWDRRLEENVPWLIRWLEEQLDGPYWQATLGRRYGEVRVPTLIIGGWADFYVNAALRWFAHLGVPTKLIMGPWPHMPPDAAVPGAHIDFLHEIARWFRQFLAGEPTGILDEPPVTVFVRTHREAGASSDTAAGYWRFEDTVPPERAVERTWYFAAEGNLDKPPVNAHAAACRYVPFIGHAEPVLAGGESAGGGPDAQPGSIAYTSAALTNSMEILGFPRMRLFAESTAEVAFFAVRLWDVAPGGPPTLVSQGLLNGTRREGMHEARPLVPNETIELVFQLDATSWVFPEGHRIAVTISGTDFPDVWPSPLQAMIRLHCGPSEPSSITLPVVPVPACPYPEPILRPPPPRKSRFEYTLEKRGVSADYDAATRRMTTRRALKETVRHPDGVTVVTSEHRTEMSVSADDPAKARAAAWDCKAMRRPDLDVQCTAAAEINSTASDFHLDLALDVKVNGSDYWRRRWVRTIPRRLL